MTWGAERIVIAVISGLFAAGIVMWVMVAAQRREREVCARCRWWSLVPCTCTRACLSAACEAERRREPGRTA